MSDLINAFSVDIETLGRGRKPAIWQIAIVGFNTDTGYVEDVRSRNPDVLGIEIFPNVDQMIYDGWHVEWQGVQFFAETQGSQKIVTDKRPPVLYQDNLEEVATTVHRVLESRDYPIWCKGPIFDLGLLQDLFYEYHHAAPDPAVMPFPANYRRVRDARTFVDELLPGYRDRVTPAHDAVLDAQQQALLIIEAMRTARAGIAAVGGGA